jgi:nitroreductase
MGAAATDLVPPHVAPRPRAVLGRILECRPALLRHRRTDNRGTSWSSPIVPSCKNSRTLAECPAHRRLRGHDRAHGREPEDSQHRDRLQYDFGQATANMMLAAVELGIGSGYSAVGDHVRARRVLGFPDGCFCAYLIALGYPTDLSRRS